MSGTKPRDSIDLSEGEKQLKEAGARPESFNWYQQIQSELKFPFDKTAQPMLGQELEILALAFTGYKVEKLLANLRLFVEGE